MAARPQTANTMSAARGLGHSGPELTLAEHNVTPVTTYDNAVLDRERLVRRGMEHLIRCHQPLRQSLRMVMPQERLQHLAISVQTVGPEIVPHQFACGADLLVE